METDVKYLLVMEAEKNDYLKMSWARCKTLEDVQDVKNLYLAHYPNAKFEVYEVSGRVE